MNPLITRIISALVMAPVAIGAIYFGRPYFDAFIALILLIGIMEWYRLCRSGSQRKVRMSWLMPGIVYIMLACLSFVWLRTSGEHGQTVVFWIFVLVWTADTGAYAAGITIGGPKLAPRISPKKTWAGLFGALVAAGIMGAFTANIINHSNGTISLVAASMVLAGISQMGDLLESYAKRHFGVKDSGAIIPGHGGVLDRVDGLLAAGLAAGIASLFYTVHSGQWP